MKYFIVVNVILVAAAVFFWFVKLNECEVDVFDERAVRATIQNFILDGKC